MELKKLSFFKRPFFAKRILEVGPGHKPFYGITHAVDKFKYDNSQRDGDIKLPLNVEFREGALEALPFTNNESFDFFYASHILEHVQNIKLSVSEINRVTKKGYLETPSPLREQLLPNKYHNYFVWFSKNTVFFIKKTPEQMGSFCDCSNGKLARIIYSKNNKELNLEPVIPNKSKNCSLLFKDKLNCVEYKNFKEACKNGSCAYSSVGIIKKRTLFVSSIFSKRSRFLRRLIEAGHRSE